MGLNRIRRAGGEKASGPFAFSGCDKIPAHEMKIISIPTSEVPQPRRRTPWNNWFFEHEEGVIDQDGVFMCPICGCCSLKPVSFSEANKAEMFSNDRGFGLGVRQWVHKNETTSRLLAGNRRGRT